MDLSSKILSDLTVFMKYAKYREDLGRRETWEELIDRNKNMHIKKFPDLKDDIERVYNFIKEKKVLPSMRALQFGGKPIELMPTRLYNCAFLAIDDWRVFHEIMFLLLGGSGVGFSVQKHHVEKLPEIRKPRKDRTRRHLIADSIEGWADSIKVLMKSYFEGTSTIKFDFNDIRPKGSPLKTSGGKAPGPEPLKVCIQNLKSILNEKEDGDQLSTLEVHDLICHIADAVLAGGIRRSALLSLFSADDMDMLTCKSGTWWELNPQRGRANNSAMILRHRVTKDFFMSIWKRIEESGSGEPGVVLSNDKEMGVNPCSEISLKSCGFCNLSEVNVSSVTTQKELNELVEAATILGTLQASYTDFHYLRNVWKRNAEKEALLGVSMTGISSGAVLKLDLEEAANVVKETNRVWAEKLGINPAYRLTTVKPSGTASCVLGTSSGIHAWHAPYYKRRVRVNKEEPVYKYLKENHPALIEDDFFKPHLQAVITIPQKAPDGSIYRDEPVLSFLERIKLFHEKWIKPGHVRGSNTHNVSATISIKDDEWDKVGEWMWKNRNVYTGLSVLPYDGGNYKQAPFEECTKEEYDELMSKIKDINLTNVKENVDNTDLKGEAACSGGSCTLEVL